MELIGVLGGVLVQKNFDLLETHLNDLLRSGVTNGEPDIANGNADAHLLLLNNLRVGFLMRHELNDFRLALWFNAHHDRVRVVQQHCLP